MLYRYISPYYAWQVMDWPGSRSITSWVAGLVDWACWDNNTDILNGKTRPKSWWSQWWLTSGCISACISASCTALGTWNLSISSIILATRLFPPFSDTRAVWLLRVSTSNRRDGDLRFVTISVVLRWRASSQQAVCRRWCDQLGDGDSTTHFRVGYPKLWPGDPL